MTYRGIYCGDDYGVMVPLGGRPKLKSQNSLINFCFNFYQPVGLYNPTGICAPIPWDTPTLLMLLKRVVPSIFCNTPQIPHPSLVDLTFRSTSDHWSRPSGGLTHWKPFS